MFKMMAASMLGVALCLGFTACSDDDENENGEGGENTATVVNPSQVFTGGLPKSVSGMAISHNEEGLVTNITTEDGDKAVFEYFPATTKADVAKDRARITVTDEEGDVTELNLQLNSDGYVEFCNSIDHAGTPDADEFTWEMEYDTEAHLVVMKRSESDGEITNITTDTVLKERKIELKETTAMLRFSGGDARKLLNILELVIDSEATDPVLITDDMVTERLQQNPLAYDKDGEMHYDIISAFIKSIRGSDPDGAIYWLARMVEGGEDPAFIARRLVISASEDIGLANPNALLLANACFDTLMKVGWPEGRIPLAEATIYLATSPKSNSAYMAINNALELVRETGNLPVPLHLRNAPTKLMKQLGYGEKYKYAHDYPGNFVKQQFLPDELKDRRIWEPQLNPAEQKHKERMQQLWGEEKKW